MVQRGIRGLSNQRAQSTLEWVIGAAVILGTLVVGIVAPNKGSSSHALPCAVTADGLQTLG